MVAHAINLFESNSAEFEVYFASKTSNKLLKQTIGEKGVTEPVETTLPSTFRQLQHKNFHLHDSASQ